MAEALQGDGRLIADACDLVLLAVDHKVLARSELAVDNAEELIARSAIVGGFSRLLAQKLLLLEEPKN